MQNALGEQHPIELVKNLQVMGNNHVAKETKLKEIRKRKGETVDKPTDSRQRRRLQKTNSNQSLGSLLMVGYVGILKRRSSKK